MPPNHPTQSGDTSNQKWRTNAIEFSPTLWVKPFDTTAKITSPAQRAVVLIEMIDEFAGDIVQVVKGNWQVH